MITCPKCGSSHIGGPTYSPPQRVGWLSHSTEALRYVCHGCGYWRYSPTLEQQKQKDSKKLT